MEVSWHPSYVPAGIGGHTQIVVVDTLCLYCRSRSILWLEYSWLPFGVGYCSLVLQDQRSCGASQVHCFPWSPHICPVSHHEVGVLPTHFWLLFCSTGLSVTAMKHDKWRRSCLIAHPDKCCWCYWELWHLAQTTVIRTVVTAPICAGKFLVGTTASTLNRVHGWSSSFRYACCSWDYTHLMSRIVCCSILLLLLLCALTFIDTMQVFVLELGQLSSEVSLSFAASH